MSLCPDVLFHRDPECFRHFLERICPLRGFLDIADALVGELRQHNISCHNRPPWLEACATWHEEGAPSLPHWPRRRHKIDRSADMSCPALLPRSRGSSAGAMTDQLRTDPTSPRSAPDVRMRLSATAV